MFNFVGKSKKILPLCQIFLHFFSILIFFFCFAAYLWMLHAEILNLCHKRCPFRIFPANNMEVSWKMMAGLLCRYWEAYFIICWRTMCMWIGSRLHCCWRYSGCWRCLNKEIFAFCSAFYPYSMRKWEMLHDLGRKNDNLVIFCLIIAIFAHKSVRDIWLR